MDSNEINTNFNDTFFEKYTPTTEEQGSLKINFYKQLTARYNYPNPIDLDDILYLIKEIAEN